MDGRRLHGGNRAQEQDPAYRLTHPHPFFPPCAWTQGMRVRRGLGRRLRTRGLELITTPHRETGERSVWAKFCRPAARPHEAHPPLTPALWRGRPIASEAASSQAPGVRAAALPFDSRVSLSFMHGVLRDVSAHITYLLLRGVNGKEKVWFTHAIRAILRLSELN